MTDALAARIFQLRRPSPKLLAQFFVHSFAGFVLMPLVFIPLYFKYKTLTYHFDARGIRASWGILFHREIFLTYARIQDIHLKRGLLERWLGIGTVEVQTASGSSSAELSIVGLEEYELLRDFLYSRMRGRHAEDEGVASKDEALVALTAIRDELRAVREALEARRDV
jgi:putative membrane protein